MFKKFYLYFSSVINNLPDRYIIAVLLCLTIPAFLYNLERNGFIGDEGIRSLVALEMKLSGDFIKPTLNGEEYFNKPPLYNWLIFTISGLFGFYGEIPSRTLSLMFLSAFAISVFFISKKYTSSFVSVLMPFMVLSSGRILFWDSMFGLIDICFSLVIYLNFMALYTFGKNQKWNLFFASSYTLCAIAFMLKGLPALVFQAISVFTALFFFSAIKKRLFSYAHIFWAILSFTPVFFYYYTYAQKVSLAKVFDVLLEQSMSRTASHHGLSKTVQHFFTFPFEQIYHFIPWSLFLLLIFNKKLWSVIKSNSFILFNFCMLVANIPVYWLSVEVYPRYLLMFIPLFNIIGIYSLENLFPVNAHAHRRIRSFLWVILLVVGVLFLGLPFYPQLTIIPHLTFWAIGSFVIMLLLAITVTVDHRRYLLWFCAALLVIRIVFNGVIIPVRNTSDKSNYCREDSFRATLFKKDSPWYVYGKTDMHMVAKFYATRDLNAIIHRVHKADDTSAIYIVDQYLYPDFNGTRVDSLYVETGRYLNLMKLN